MQIFSNASQNASAPNLRVLNNFPNIEFLNNPSSKKIQMSIRKGSHFYQYQSSLIFSKGENNNLLAFLLQSARMIGSFPNKHKA